VITNLVVERSLRNKEGRKNNDKKGHLNQIADIARRFCALSSNKVASEIAEITNEHELLEAMSTMLAENASLRDKMDEQACRIAYLEELATSDELTGVLNRRGFEAELKRVLARAKRDIEQGILVYIDLDEFKPINDTHGHAAGDEVLRKVAAILNEMTRDMDVIGRLGGDEFGAILVNASEKEAREKAESLAKAIAETPLNWNGQQVSMKISIGAYSLQGGEDASDMLEQADKAMYDKKSPTGRRA